MFKISPNLLINEYPYPHFFDKPNIDLFFKNEFLKWLEHSAPWELTIADFYEQYEFSLWDATLPNFAEFLIDEKFLSYLRDMILHLFKKKVSHRVDVVAHKLIKSQKIKIHNDYIEGAETHRILLHLNRNWSEDFGGYFMVFENSDVNSLVNIAAPENGMLQGFEISPKSHHAVSEIHGGERYTVIYSFYGENN